MMFVIHAIAIKMSHHQKQNKRQKSNKYINENLFRNVFVMLYGLIILKILELVCVNVV